MIVAHLSVLAGHTDCPGRLSEKIPDLIAAVHTRKLEIFEQHG
jgi:hypothetical protein